MRRTLTAILTLALITMGAGAFGQDSVEPNPELLQKQATEARFMQLMQLKQRADKAEAQRAKQAWAEDGRRMQDRAEWSADGNRMVEKREWAEDGRRMQDKGQWAAQGRAQMQWPETMEWYRTNAGQIAPLRFEASAHPYSPLGLILKDMDAALAEGNITEANRLLSIATKLYRRTL